MADPSQHQRPERLLSQPVPPVPDLEDASGEASTRLSYYRSNLSYRRTGLSEHRTDLSEYRTDLSGERTEMSMRRTSLSFQRTRMSADRTLMSVIRTSLSLIGFGFTIYQAFDKMREAGIIHQAAAPRNFGVALIAMGMLMLVGGILQHAIFLRDLRRTRANLIRHGLIHGEAVFPISNTFVAALALLLLGAAAIVGIVFRIAPLG